MQSSLKAGLLAKILLAFSLFLGSASAASYTKNIKTDEDANWSNELKGGKWGWFLPESLENIYRVDGQVLLLLREPAIGPKRILWDPVTGVQHTLDAKALAEFKERYDHERSIPFLYVNSVRLHVAGVKFSDGRFLASFTTPNVVYKCESMNFRYYELTQNDGSKASFYLVHRLNRPMPIKYFSCPEADDAVEHHMMVNFAMDFDMVTDLSDGSVLFIAPGGSGHLLLVRLDRLLQQHSSVGGRVFKFDATKFNDQAPPVTNDLETYHSFLKYMSALPGSPFSYR